MTNDESLFRIGELDQHVEYTNGRRVWQFKIDDDDNEAIDRFGYHSILMRKFFCCVRHSITAVRSFNSKRTNKANREISIYF